MPGAVAGAVAGNRLGAVRDAKGKSVAEVFTSLDHGAKAEVGSFRWLFITVATCVDADLIFTP